MLKCPLWFDLHHPTFVDVGLKQLMSGLSLPFKTSLLHVFNAFFLSFYFINIIYKLIRFFFFASPSGENFDTLNIHFPHVLLCYICIIVIIPHRLLGFSDFYFKSLCTAILFVMITIKNTFIITCHYMFIFLVIFFDVTVTTTC